MNTTKNLLIIILLPVVTSIILGVTFYNTYISQKTLASQNELIDNILINTGKLRIYAFEYNQYGYDRAKNQWIATYARLESLSKKLSSKSTIDENPQLQHRVKKYSKNSYNLFMDIIENYDISINNSNKMALHREINNRLNGQLLSTIDSIDTNLFQLKTASNKSIDIQNKEMLSYIFWTVLIVIVLSLQIGFVIYRSTKKTIFDLEDSKRLVSKNAKLLADAQSLAHLGSWELDIVNNKLEWSDEIYRIFEIDPENFCVSYEAFLNAIHPDDREKVNNAYVESLETKKSYKINHRLLMPDGSIKHVLEQCETIFADDGTPLQSNGTVQDVSDMVSIEDQLRHTQKMDALGKLTGGIAHDYNNLLGIIKGYSDLLTDNLNKDSHLLDYAKNIQTAAERGTSITGKLLSFSRQRTLVTTALNINTLLIDQRLMLEKVLTTRLKLHYELEEDLWTIALEQGEMESAILNLCINAMHAITANGDIIIRTKNHKLSGSESKLLFIPPGEYVLFSLIDNGCGMDELTKAKIFDPFFSTKGERGTGLGLSQIYGFVERSGGTISVHSQPGHGSHFDLYFPRSKQSIKNKQLNTSQVPVNISGTESVLVVDDEKALAQLNSNAFSNNGYRVFTANDGLEAIAILESNTIDLIITDVVMPNMDGYQLAEHVLEKYPKIPIQMVSGFADDRRSNAINKTLHNNLLYKPYSITDLLSKARSLLDKAKAEEQESSSKKTILIMDDDEDIKKLFEINLNRMGYNTVLSSNGEEAIEIYQKSAGSNSPIDLVIVDLSIPGGLGGKDTAEEIRKFHQEAKIIVSSGDSMCPEMTDFKAFGFDGALEKNFNKIALKHTIDKALKIL